MEEDFIYDTTTNDWTGLSFEPQERRGKKRKIKKYIGICTNFPKNAKTEEELYEICKQLDSHHWLGLEVNHWALVESHIQGIITSGQLSVLHYLTSKVGNWNVVFCNIKELPCHEKTAYKVLKELSPWNIRIVENDKGNLKILISPFLVWKGDKLRREKHIKEWYESAKTLETN